MSKELQPIPQTVITDAELLNHLENLGLIKDLTLGEKNSYLQICKAYNLNPFKREVHVSKYNGQMSIITGYETYIKRAERSGVLDGWEVTTTGTVKDADLKAVIKIYRKDRSHPFIWEAKYSEYVQKTKEGVVTKFWQKSETMIKKVVMAQGFRLCFNDELGGMPYSREEIGTDDILYKDVQNVQVTVADVPAPWHLTAEAQAELVGLIKTSTLDTASADAAAEVIAGAKDQATIDKVRVRLLVLQTPSL